jgi:hypothetical protein
MDSGLQISTKLPTALQSYLLGMEAAITNAA